MDPLLEQLKDDESFIEYAYQDSKGFWTIGYGRMIDRRLGGGITKSEGEFLLNNDVTKVLVDLDRELPWWRRLDEVRQRVLADMAFNLGITKLLKFKRTLEAIRTGDVAGAVEGMRNSDWYHQVSRRSKRLVLMMESGRDPGPQEA